MVFVTHLYNWTKEVFFDISQINVIHVGDQILNGIAFVG